MVVHHVVLLKLRDSVNGDDFLKLAREALDKIPVGTNGSISAPMRAEKAQGWQYGIYRTFKDDDEFLKYVKCDEHQHVVNVVLKGKASDMISFQINGSKL